MRMAMRQGFRAVGPWGTQTCMGPCMILLAYLPCATSSCPCSLLHHASTAARAQPATPPLPLTPALALLPHPCCASQLFLQRALMPLHKPKCVAMYHQQLAYCVTQVWHGVVGWSIRGMPEGGCQRGRLNQIMAFGCGASKGSVRLLLTLLLKRSCNELPRSTVCTWGCAAWPRGC